MKRIIFFAIFIPIINTIIFSISKDYKTYDEVYIAIGVLGILCIAYEMYKIKKMENMIKNYPKKLDLYFDNEFQKELTEWEKYKKQIFYILIIYIFLILISLYEYVKR